MKSATNTALLAAVLLIIPVVPAFADAKKDLDTVYQDTQNFDGSKDLDGLSVNTKPADTYDPPSDVPEPEGVPVDQSDKSE